MPEEQQSIRAPKSVSELLRAIASSPLAMGASTALGGLAGAGGAAYLASREQARRGETPEERKARILRNAAVGGALGGAGVGGSLYGAALLTNPVASHFNPNSFTGRFINAMRQDNVGYVTTAAGAGSGAVTNVIRQAIANRNSPVPFASTTSTGVLAPPPRPSTFAGAFRAAGKGAGFGAGAGMLLPLAPLVLDFSANTYDKWAD